MAEARSRLEWEQTAQLSYLIYSANRVGGPEKTPGDFTPYPQPEKPLLKMPISALKVFVRS